MTRIVLFLLLLTATAVSSSAHTWYVAKDGTGDFEAIQAAVDAASPGDTVWIRAGRYEELNEQWDAFGDGSWLVDCHVAITKDNLTLRGDGADVTIIGPETFPANPDPGLVGIIATQNYATSATVRDLGVENVVWGISLRNPVGVVNGCRVEGTREDGIRLRTTSGCVIDGCQIVGGYSGILSETGSGLITVDHSTITGFGSNGVVGLGTDRVEVRNTVITGGAIAVHIAQGTVGLVEDVEASGFSACGVFTAQGGSAEVYDSEFYGGTFGVWAKGVGLRCERCTFSGQTGRVAEVFNYGPCVLHDCTFEITGVNAVNCRHSGNGDCHIDMTNNYWGTDSEAQIAEWIHDSNDEPERCCTVDFVPFHSESTPTESHSWSEVKSLFRGGGE